MHLIWVDIIEIKGIAHNTNNIARFKCTYLFGHKQDIILFLKKLLYNTHNIYFITEEAALLLRCVTIYDMFAMNSSFFQTM